MPPDFPLELQHYILELALPPPTSRTGSERRRLLRTFSLVHLSWTPVAQRLLFSRVRVSLEDFEHIKGVADVALQKVKAVGALEVNLDVPTIYLLVGWEAFGELLEHCPKLKECSLWMTPSSLIPLSHEWPSSLKSFTLIEYGWRSASPELSSLRLSSHLPLRLTRLFLTNVGNLTDFPTIPTLQTLLLGTDICLPSRLELYKLFPILRVFAWDSAFRVTEPLITPNDFVFPTLPSSSISHARLLLPPELPVQSAADLLTTLPKGLQTLDIRLPQQASPTPRRLQDALTELKQETQVRLLEEGEPVKDIEEWELTLS
ncbi:hypothetical protein JCM6882_008382 [Rhodosporidiobolus microsporus]